MTHLLFGIGKQKAQSPVVTFGLGVTGITLVTAMMILSDMVAWPATITDELAFEAAISDQQAFTVTLGCMLLASMLVNAEVNIDMMMNDEELFAHTITETLAEMAIAETLNTSTTDAVATAMSTSDEAEIKMTVNDMPLNIYGFGEWP